MSKLNITLNKNSLIDYPGKITAIVFLSGCNLNCWYCHNRHILKEESGNMDVEQAFDFLAARVGFLDAVTFSGGEALIHDDLIQWVKRAKELSYLVKLDTNGVMTDKLKGIVETGLIDYVAMDIKAPLLKYHLISKGADEKAIFKSAKYLMSSSVEYEFRTTFVPLMGVEDIENIAKYTKGAKAYYIQQYKKPEGIKGCIFPEPLGNEVIREAAAKAKKYVKNTYTRGI